MNNVIDFLNEKLNNQYGIETTKLILEGYKSVRKTTFRVNTLKVNLDEVLDILKEEKIEFELSSFIDNAIIVDNSYYPILKNHSLFNDGKIYLQSLSSMLPPLILNPLKGKDLLDMAAAPGGKTTQIAALTNNENSIMAVEPNKIRMDKLKFNCERLGVTNVNFVLSDARKLDDYFSFDQILLDAPCSGSGTLSFNDKSMNSFSKELVKNSSILQTQLLKKAFKMLKKGCEMVYSTCSILKEENEEVILKALKGENFEIVPIDEVYFSNLPTLPCSIDKALCVMPTEYYEGFFVCKILKK